MSKIIRDYQWPSSFYTYRKYVNKKETDNKKKLKIIEGFFKKHLFNHKVFLFPSARACIALIIRYLKKV